MSLSKMRLRDLLLGKLRVTGLSTPLEILGTSEVLPGHQKLGTLVWLSGEMFLSHIITTFNLIFFKLLK